jgi:hypothetical protein
MAAKSKRQRPTTEPQSDAGEEPLLRSSDPEARELLDLAIRVKRLKPWQWMEETDLIGIENPETREIGFISVMGSVGEYEAVALYLGAEGFHGFIDFVKDESATMDRLLERPHLQAAFSERKYLEKWDRDLIKQLGMKFTGAGPWPMFRSYRPGYLPWFVTLAEARFLIHALSQTLHVATSVRDEAEPFHPTGRVEKGGYLMRVSRRAESELIWEDQVWQIPRPKAEPIRASVDSVVLEQLKRIPQSELELEADLFLSPGSMGEPGRRPLALYVMMVADSDSGFILGVDAMTAESSLAAMRASIPNSFAKMLLQNRAVPRRLMVRSELLRNLLKTLTQSLNIELRFSNELPRIDEAADSMGEWMRTGKMWIE